MNLVKKALKWLWEKWTTCPECKTAPFRGYGWGPNGPR